MGTNGIDPPSYCLSYIDTFFWDGMVMPNESYDRHHQDSALIWPSVMPAGRLKTSSRHRGRRVGDGTLPWSEMDKQPAGTTSRGGLNTR